MDKSAVVYLISETWAQDEYGVMVPTETKRQVYAQIGSVTATEWFEGGRNGLNPEYRIRIYDFEYQGEEILEYNGVRYTIYRTYNSRNDILELYVEKRKGHADEPEQPDDPAEPV